MARLALVTETSTGIGRAVAIHLKSRGLEVLGGVRRIEDAPAGLEPILLDVTLRALVNNAGNPNALFDQEVKAVSDTQQLKAVLEAFNAHDVDAILSYFTEDCILDTPHGQRMVGKEQVRKGFQARFDGIPDIVYADDRHFASGDRGVSEWTIRGTQVNGEPIEVRGCDLFEFTEGKISRKDSYWKILE